MEITNAELLSASHSNNLIQESLHLNSVQAITLDGRILKNVDSGIAATWQEASGYVNNDWEDITINGVYFGQGKVDSVSFPGDRDVKEKKYSINLSFYKNGYLGNMTGLMGGITFPSTGDIKYIKGLQESFSFDGDPDGEINSERSISFNVEKTKTGNAVLIAKNFASGLFDNNPALTLINSGYPAFYKDSGNRTYTESYDSINHSYSFKEKFQYRNGQNYSWQKGFDLNFDAGGFTQVSERGTIRGVKKPYYNSASGGFSAISGGVYDRCSQILNAYSGIYNSACQLIDLPTSRSVGSDLCRGVITYNESYTNNPSHNASGYSWTYTNRVNRGNDGVYRLSENGNIKGIGPNRSANFENAKNGLQTISGDAIGRVSTAFTGITPLLNGDCTGDSKIRLSNSSETYEERKGQVSYSLDFTTDPYLIDNDSKFCRIQITSGDTTPNHIVNNFSVVSDKVYSQASNQSTLGFVELNIDMIGKQCTEINDYITGALGSVNTGSYLYLADASYSFAPRQRNFRMNLVLAYSGYREFDDVLIW